MPTPLYERVAARIPALARRMIATLLDEVPIYRLLPQEQLEGEVLSICELNLRGFFRTLVEDRPPSELELAEPRASAVRRAQERVPLSSVLTAYHVGARLSWEEMCHQATPEETTELLTGAGAMFRYVQVVVGEVATSYLEEQQAITGEERDAVRALVTALLTGEPADLLAERVGHRLATSWVVLALDLAEHPDEASSAEVAGRRKVRRVQAQLDEHAGQAVLGRLDATGGIVLLPDEEPSLVAVRRLVADLQEAAGADVRAAAARAASTGEVADAAAQAREVLRLAGSRPALYLLPDVLLDYQLARPSDAQPHLAAVLSPLDEHPDLLLTLQSYLAHSSDRRTSAGALHIHPNTLDYRLKRVLELTGLDPARTQDVQLLAASLAVRRLRAL